MRFWSIPLLFLLLIPLHFADNPGCATCDQFTNAPQAGIFVLKASDPTNKSIQVIAYYDNLSASPSRQPLKNNIIIIEMSNQTGFYELQKTYTDDNGVAVFDYSSWAGGCIDFRAIYCPFCIPTDAVCEGFQQCINFSKIQTAATKADDIDDALDANPPAVLSSDKYLPQLGSISYCPPPAPISATPALCLPLLIVFSLLSGALYLSGKNPFAGFNIGGARVGQHIRYQARGRGFSMSVTQIAMAALSIGQAAKSASKTAKAEGKGKSAFSTFVAQETRAANSRGIMGLVTFQGGRVQMGSTLQQISGGMTARSGGTQMVGGQLQAAGGSGAGSFRPGDLVAGRRSRGFGGTMSIIGRTTLNILAFIGVNTIIGRQIDAIYRASTISRENPQGRSLLEDGFVNYTARAAEAESARNSIHDRNGNLKVVVPITTGAAASDALSRVPIVGIAGTRSPERTVSVVVDRNGRPQIVNNLDGSTSITIALPAGAGRGQVVPAQGADGRPEAFGRATVNIDANGRITSIQYQAAGVVPATAANPQGNGTVVLRQPNVAGGPTEAFVLVPRPLREGETVSAGQPPPTMERRIDSNSPEFNKAVSAMTSNLPPLLQVGQNYGGDFRDNCRAAIQTDQGLVQQRDSNLIKQHDYNTEHMNSTVSSTIEQERIHKAEALHLTDDNGQRLTGNAALAEAEKRRIPIISDTQVQFERAGSQFAADALSSAGVDARGRDPLVVARTAGQSWENTVGALDGQTDPTRTPSNAVNIGVRNDPVAHAVDGAVSQMTRDFSPAQIAAMSPEQFNNAVAVRAGATLQGGQPPDAATATAYLSRQGVNFGNLRGYVMENVTAFNSANPTFAGATGNQLVAVSAASRAADDPAALLMARPQLLDNPTINSNIRALGENQAEQMKATIVATNYADAYRGQPPHPVEEVARREGETDEQLRRRENPDQTANRYAREELTTVSMSTATLGVASDPGDRRVPGDYIAGSDKIYSSRQIGAGVDHPPPFSDSITRNATPDLEARARTDITIAVQHGDYDQAHVLVLNQAHDAESRGDTTSAARYRAVDTAITALPRDVNPAKMSPEGLGMFTSGVGDAMNALPRPDTSGRDPWQDSAAAAGGARAYYQNLERQGVPGAHEAAEYYGGLQTRIFDARTNSHGQPPSDEFRTSITTDISSHSSLFEGVATTAAARRDMLREDGEILRHERPERPMGDFPTPPDRRGEGDMAPPPTRRRGRGTGGTGDAGDTAVA